MHCFQHKVRILVDGYPQTLLYGALCDQEGPTEVPGLHFLEPCVVGKGLAGSPTI